MRLLCFLGFHRYQWRGWISEPQSASVNCRGDDWYVGELCGRCGRWQTFETGRAFLSHRDRQKLLAGPQ